MEVICVPYLCVWLHISVCTAGWIINQIRYVWLSLKAVEKFWFQAMITNITARVTQNHKQSFLCTV
jgi:hypothetical protein